MRREAQVALTCQNTRFCAGWNKLRIREKLEVMFWTAWNKVSSMQSDVFTTEFGYQKT